MSSYREKSYFQWIYTGIGISVFLLLLLILFSFFFISKNLVLDRHQHIKYALELEAQTTESELNAIRGFLESQEYYKENSFEWISKAAIQNRFQPYLADSLNTYFSLPFKDIVFFEINEASTNKTQRMLIKTELLKKPVIENVYYEDKGYDQARNSIEKIIKGLGAMALILFFLSLLFLYNTIHSAIHARREIIQNQILLGATKSMVARPIIASSLITALIAALIALSGMYIINYYLTHHLLSTEIYLNNNYIIYLLVLTGSVVVVVPLFTWIILQSRIRLRSK